jgi:hypothetical protein
VIEANLGRLRTVLSDCSPGLGDDLDSFTRTFMLYVGRLRDASTAAITDE